MSLYRNHATAGVTAYGAFYLVTFAAKVILKLIRGTLILTGLPFSVASFIGYVSHLYMDGELFKRKRSYFGNNGRRTADGGRS